VRLYSPVDEDKDVIEGKGRLVVVALAKDSTAGVAALSGSCSRVVDSRDDQKEPGNYCQQLVCEDAVLRV
jgi:hypothetical protein